MKIVKMNFTAATALLFVSLPALAAEFHAYAFSGERQALLTVAIELPDGSSAAPPVHVTPLGFKGTTIVAHPSRPWLYVSAASAAGDASGGPQPCT
jgi:hypothetical protein